MKKNLVEKNMDLRFEDYPETHDGAMDFVKNVFQSMGGTVLPPSRPNKGYRYKNSAPRDAFMMDFENACLEQNWAGEPPRGPKRHENPEWQKMIQSQVYPHHSEIDWYDYVEFCESGGGDEWFQEDINE